MDQPDLERDSGAGTIPPDDGGELTSDPVTGSGTAGTGQPKPGAPVGNVSNETQGLGRVSDRASDGAPDRAGHQTTDHTADVVARLLGRPRIMPRRQVSAAAGASLLSARRFWHALGFPRVGDDDSMFTDADLDALSTVVRMVRADVVDEATALALTRAVALSADRLTAWQTSLAREMINERAAQRGRLNENETEESEPVTEAVDPSSASSRAGAEEIAELLLTTSDELEKLMAYAWRRHLAAAISQLLAEAHPSQDRSSVRTIGFADMVEFTPLVRRLTERELAYLVQRFYTLATDVVTAHGGRVVKTIGDEVVFVTEGAGPAAAIALDLVEELREDSAMPELRVGMATGPVTSHLGDVFGTTVNRASRLTQAARPGTVLIDDASAAALGAVSGFRMLRLRTRTLRGLGPTRMWVLRRTAESTRRGLWHDVSSNR